MSQEAAVCSSAESGAARWEQEALLPQRRRPAGPPEPRYHPCDLEATQKVCRAVTWDYHREAFYFYTILLLPHMLCFLNAEVMLILNQLQYYLNRQPKKRQILLKGAKMSGAI